MMDHSMGGAEGNKGPIAVGGHNDFNSFEDFDSYIGKDGAYKVCTLCGKFRNKTITNVRCHVESKHFPGTFQYNCEICSKICTSKTSLRDHMLACKKQHMQYDQNMY